MSTSVYIHVQIYIHIYIYIYVYVFTYMYFLYACIFIYIKQSLYFSCCSKAVSFQSMNSPIPHTCNLF